MAPRHLLIATLLVGGCSGAAPVAETGPLIPKPEVRVGDRWTYWAVDYFTNQMDHLYSIEVTFVKGDAILGVTRTGEGAPQEAAWTSSWNATVSETGTVLTPNEALLRFPIRVGNTYFAKWDTDFEKSMDRGQYGFYTSGNLGTHQERTVIAMAWEDVVVPAGKFHALRIEAHGYLSRSNNPGISALAQDTIWYVPEVHRWVKRVRETYFFGRRSRWDGEEMLRYEPARRPTTQ